MTDVKVSERHVTKMVVLGEGFQVGDLYDYRTDRIVTGRRCWESDEMSQAILSDNGFKLKLKHLKYDSTLNNKWETMGLDEHSQASVAAGFIEKYRGAAKYLNDQSAFAETSHVLLFRAKSKKISLDFQILLSQDVPHLREIKKETKDSTSTTNPTHVVVGVTYGVEAYCVLTLKTGEDAGEEAKKYLSEIAGKMEEALENYQDSGDFKDEFDKDEKTQLNRIKCRLYADLQTSTVQECSVFDAYKHCLKLIQQTRANGVGNKKSMPIAVLLCPLNVIMGQAEGEQFEYHHVDQELVTRCSFILDELDRICAKSAVARTFNTKADSILLRELEDTIVKYKGLVQRCLKNGIIKARTTGQQDEIEKVTVMAENHSMFKPSRLEQMLLYKIVEREMMYHTASNTTNIVRLESKQQLEIELQNSFDAKHALVLNVPSLDDRMNEMFEAMKNYLAFASKVGFTSSAVACIEDDGGDIVISSNVIERKQKHVLAKIRELADHVEKNKHLENQVQFFIVFNQPAKEFGCRYSVYKTGALLTEKLSQLPGCPTNLRIRAPKSRNVKRTSMYPIDVEWDYADLDLPCHFLVEYRLDGNKDEPWTQRRTSKPGEIQISITYKTGWPMMIRVAADTCIGRSGFSEVVDTITMLDLNDDDEGLSEKASYEMETCASQEKGKAVEQIERNGAAAASSALTDQQPFANKITEADLQTTSGVVTSSTLDRDQKAPTTRSLNKMENVVPLHQKNEDGAISEHEDDVGLPGEGEMKNDAIQQHITKMVVLANGFQVGELYDYTNDCIVTDGPKCWESSKLKSATHVDNTFVLEFEVPGSGSDSLCNRMENMGLDTHLQASIMAGLIEKPRGSSKYLSHQSGPLQATQVLICRAKSREVTLDLKALPSQGVPHLRGIGKETKSSKPKTNPTHVVVGVAYGAEAYCVLTQDLKGAETDDDAREEVEKYLSAIATKMTEALEERQAVHEFKEGFTSKEKKQLGITKCRLYTDFLQTSAVQECSVSESYKHCLNFIQQVQKTGVRNNKPIAIAALLCPLPAITGQAEGEEFEDHDVDQELVARCGRIRDQLDRIHAKSIAIRAVNKKIGNASLRHFEETVIKYKELMQETLKDSTVKARQTGKDEPIEKVAKIAENHPLFKPTRLEQWLSYKQAECGVYDTISKMTKILCLTSKEQLVRNLNREAEGDFETKYTMVCSLPCLNKETNEILEAMKQYAESYAKLVALDDNEEEGDDGNILWQQIERKHKSVISKVREFAQHVEKNKHLEDKVQFLITFCEMPIATGCRYSVYDHTGQLLKDDISQMPGPPTGLRIHAVKSRNAKNAKSVSIIAVEWDYEDLGYPCHFLVEYQPEESWMQKKTVKPGETQIEIPYKTGSMMAIRVAADTCIGRSEFSEEFNIDADWVPSDDEETTSDISMCSGRVVALSETGRSSMKNLGTVLQPPTRVEIETVTQKTAELGWTRAANKKKGIFYRVLYWPSGQDSSSIKELEVASGESGCRLEDLQPGTKYCAYVVAVSQGGQEVSAPSEEVVLTTLEHMIRFAEIIVKRCKKIDDRNGMEILAVPLAKSADSNSTVKRHVFGQQNSRTAKAQHRTILVMGATGAGKTTLINGMINYIFGVEWDDAFRFQLIREELVGHSQSGSQTSVITAYDIYHAEGFRIPYSLTIVDTPGYGDTKGLERDKEITQMIHNFFKDKNGIQQLDVIGFVAQASLPRLTPTQMYIFDSVLSIFGKDVKENIDFLLTFADRQVPPVLTAIAEANLPCPKDTATGLPRHHKFNNSGFFCSNRESGSDASNNVDAFNRFFWRMGMENFRLFFVSLATMKTKSLSLTQQVLEERKRLEATVNGLQPRIKYGLSKMEEMRKIKQMITDSQAQIEANENVEFEVEVNKPRKVEYKDGYLTNCNKCYVTCHLPCAFANDDEKVNCAAMDHSMSAEIRTCTVCPKKCIWNIHVNQPYRWEYVLEKQKTSSDEIKKKYEKELKKKLSAQQLVKELEKDVEANDKIVLEDINTVTRCIKELDEIALRPNPFSTTEYIDLIIDAEKSEKRQGYNERIASLKKLRNMSVITTRITNGENVMTLDRMGDFMKEDDSDNDDAHDDDEDQVSLRNAETNQSRFKNISKFFPFRK